MSDENPTAIKLVRRNTAKENQDVLKECLWKSDDERGMIRSMKRMFNVDIRDAKAFPVMERSFSFKRMKQKLEEADSLGAFSQVTRAGVQAIANSAYQTVPTTFEQWTHAVPSSKLEELYAPLQGIGFPSQVGENEVYPEVGAAGLDISLRNRKYGTLWPVTKELIEDDQTGQFQQQSALLGEYAKQVLEVIAYAKLASTPVGTAKMTYSNLTVPPSETKPTNETNYPWSTSLVGGGRNRPDSFGALSQANIQNGFISLMNQLNLLGLKMSVMPDSLLVSPKFNFDLAVLLNSAYYPSGAAAAGNTGGAFAINPIQGLANKIVSRFMFDNAGSVNANSSAWYLVDSTKPWFVMQVRDAAAIEIENPESGQSFDRDVTRFKVRTRCNGDFIDPRFAWQGSDGSV